MPDYAVFGGYLRSELPFPELRPVTDCTPTWTLRISDAKAPAGDGQLLGEYEGVGRQVYIYRRDGGFRIQYSDALGTFDISADGAQITWCPEENADIEIARLAIIGRMLPTALHAAGTLCLHGSAIAFEQGGVAFLAPSTSGKSTLALACARAGGRLLTDDTLPVDPGPPVTVGPGVHAVRVWGDSARHLLGDDLRSNRAPYGKHILEELPMQKVMHGRVPLAAVYLLQPVKSIDDGSAVRRMPTPGVLAAVNIVSHLKVGAVMGAAESSLSFDRAVRVAQSVPVYTLAVVRELGRIDEVVAQIRDWHAQPLPSGELAAALP
jgi:hypothetical protein